MTNWIVVAPIRALQEALDDAFPDRPKPDGTIGDAAHLTGSSGHNPDDTPGVTAERQDTDSIPEVRALDVAAFETLTAVIIAILESTDKNRLIYIIYRGSIWRKANGWRREYYTGNNKHFDHAHFSFDPAYDTDASPWHSVKGLQMTDSIVVANTHDRIRALQTGQRFNLEDPPVFYRTLDTIAATVEQTAQAVTELSGLGGLTADDRAAIQALTDAVNALNSRLSSP